jgi:hypothetical protein
MKLVLKVLVSVVAAMLLLVLLSGSLSAQKAQVQAAKGRPAPVYVAEFVGNVGPSELPAKILGDGGTYPVTTGSTGGFGLTANVAEGRVVRFLFDNPKPVYPTELVCRAWGKDEWYNRPEGYPLYARSDSRIATPDRTVFQTQFEMVYYDGQWARILLSDAPKKEYQLFNMAGMDVGQTAYTTLLTYFRFVDSSDTFYVNFSDTFGRDMHQLDSGMHLNGGVVEVEHPVANEWFIRPISNNFPVLGDSTMEIPQYQANHVIYDVPDLKGQQGGNCNLGDFLMPFEIKVTRIR